MTIYFGEIWDGRETTFDDRDNSAAVRQWNVVTDNKNIRETAIVSYGIANGFLPNRYTAHPDNAYLLCRRIKCRQDAISPLKWLATAEYSSVPLKESDREKEETVNPLDRPAKVRWTTNRYQKAIYEAKTNVKFVDNSGTEIQNFFAGGVGTLATTNSAGDYFDPPITKDVSHANIVITKNIAGAPDWILTADFPINSTTVTIGGKAFPKQTLKLQEFEISELQNEGDYQFYVFTFQIEYRKETWKVKVLDQGMREKSGSARVNIKDTNGRVVTAPWPLNGLGAAIANPTPANAIYMVADIYDELDFNTLPIT